MPLWSAPKICPTRGINWQTEVCVVVSKLRGGMVIHEDHDFEREQRESKAKRQRGQELAAHSNTIRKMERELDELFEKRGHRKCPLGRGRTL